MPVNYDGPDESVECAYPGCSNRLRPSDFNEPQFCSKEHRDVDSRDAAKTRARAEFEVADFILEHAADLERQAQDWRVLARKILNPPVGTTVEIAYGIGGYPLVRFVTELAA